MKDKSNEVKSNVESTFDLAVQLVKSLPQKGSFQPSYSDAAKIYSYFKQAKFGPCTSPRPSFWEPVNRAKWDAWSELGDLPQEEAMVEYIKAIKQVYTRFMETKGFEEQVEQHCHVLIPFCHATNIPLPSKLISILKEEELKKFEVKLKNGYDDPVYNLITNGNHTSILENSFHHDTEVNHSLILENAAKENIVNGQTGCSFRDSSKEELYDSFDFEGINKEVVESDEEVYCDSLDPDQLLAGSRKEVEHEFDATNIPNNSDLLLTASDETSKIGEVTSLPSCILSQPVNGLAKSLSNDIQLLNSPCFSDNNTIDNKGTNCDNICTSGSRHIKSHSRTHKGNSKPNSSTYSNSRTNQGSANYSSSQQNQSVTGQVDISSETKHHRYRDLSSSNHSDFSGSESSSFSSSGSSDNVGLKIVQALERMEKNLYMVVERLDSIEASLRNTRSSNLWWRWYFPSNFMVVWVLWPILVNLFFLWLRKRKLRSTRLQ